jgi:hypothetical protein
MKKKPSIASKKLSHGQQKTQQSRLTLTIFPPPKTQASTEKYVQLDLNNAEFQRTWIALESARGIGFRQGNNLCVLLVSADHDVAYGKK